MVDDRERESHPEDYVQRMLGLSQRYIEAGKFVSGLVVTAYDEGRLDAPSEAAKSNFDILADLGAAYFSFASLIRKASTVQPIEKWGIGNLNPKELETLKLIAEGSHPTKVANQEGVAAKTIYTRLTRMYPKLGVEDKESAVQLAVEVGLAEFSPHSKHYAHTRPRGRGISDI